MALVIDSTDVAYIAQAQAALDALLGIIGALTYTTQRYRVGDRYVIRVTEGPQINTAQGFRPHSSTLVRRVIASAHWTRIVFDNANNCSPDKWLKDKMWSGIKGLNPFVKEDAGFMRKVTSTGSSSVARWSGLPDVTANLSMMGTLRMGQVANFILLAHELIHADRIGRGLLLSTCSNSTFLVDQRQRHNAAALAAPLHQVAQPGFTSATVLGGNLQLPGRMISNANNVITSMAGGQVWVTGSMELAEEIATVGLSDDDGIVPLDAIAITENMVRQEHGVHKRLKYGAFNRLIQ